MAAAQEAQKKLNHKLKIKEPFFGQQMEKALQHNGVLGLSKPLTLSWSRTTKDLKMSAPGGAGICVRGARSVNVIVLGKWNGRYRFLLVLSLGERANSMPM